MTDALECLTEWCDLNTNTLAPEWKAKDIIAALSAAGLVIVPKEPTEKMTKAAVDKDSCIFEVTAVCVWRAMVGAASDE